MQWCQCGRPGASMCQAQPASSPVSLPSLPASTTRSSTSAWAPNSAKTSLCCCHAYGGAGRSYACNTLKTSNLRLRPRLLLHHFPSRSWGRNTPKESWANPILTATQVSTALLRLLHQTWRRSFTLMCPHTLKHQSTGVTDSEDSASMSFEPVLQLQGRLRVFFVFFGLTHVNKLYVCLQINYFLNLRVSQLFERVFISSPNISCGEIQDSSQNVSSWWNVQSKPKRDKGCTKTSGTTDASTAEACDGTAFCHFPCCPWGHSCQIRYTLLYPTFFRGCQIMCCLYPSTEASAWSKSFLLRKNIYFPTPVNKLEQLYFWQVSTLILVLTENKQPCKRSFSNILNEKWCTSTIKV